MKYRKKAIVIDAIQFHGDHNWADVQDFIGDAGNSYSTHCTIKTLEGAMTAQPGDWIIRGIKGEYYPCKDDIFQASYDEVGHANY